MKKTNLKILIINFSLLSLFTFFVFEIAFTFLVSQKSKNNNLKDNKDSQELSYLVHKPNLNKKFFRTIIGNEQNLYKKEIKFETDSIGAILPSSFKNIVPGDKYVLFCGGSTTEASQVNINNRPSDVFTRLSGIKSINLAKSGKTLKGCISTIKNFNFLIDTKHSKLPYPSKYIIATNINALMDFGREQYRKNIDIKNKTFFSSNLIKFVSKIIKYKSRNSFFNINLSNYEQALLDGCCFGVSQINSKELSPRTINWEDNKIKESYKKFLNKSFKELNLYLKKMNLSNKNIVIAIEPNSFHIKYDKIFQSYWKGIDSRQLLKNYSGDKLSFESSSDILNKFNQIYQNVAISNNFQIITQDPDKIPDFSFYDAVHTTDIGSVFIGKTYAKKIKIESGF